MKKLLEEFNAYCQVCEKRTDWEYIDVLRDFSNRNDYYMYNCKSCDNTRCLQTLLLEKENGRGKRR